MGMRYDGEKQEHGKGNNVIIVVLCIAILILTFMLFIINISRLRNLFSGDSRKTQTESTQNSNVVLSGSAGGEDPEAGGGAGSGSTTDTAVDEEPAAVPAELPVEEAAAVPAEEEKEEAEKEDSDADRIIAFADPVLKDAVRRALGITDKDVRVRNTYGITSLLLENDSAGNSRIIDDLTASGRISVKIQSSCSFRKSGVTSIIPVTPVVFCAVRAVIALMA